jgi:hypothetical protein
MISSARTRAQGDSKFEGGDVDHVAVQTPPSLTLSFLSGKPEYNKINSMGTILTVATAAK